MASMVHQNTHTSYDVLQNSIQQEWDFFQSVIPVIGETFRPVKKALQKSFLTDLFQKNISEVPDQGFTRLPVNQVGLVIPTLAISSLENWMDSCVVRGQLVADL